QPTVYAAWTWLLAGLGFWAVGDVARGQALLRRLAEVPTLGGGFGWSVAAILLGEPGPSIDDVPEVDAARAWVAKTTTPALEAEAQTSWMVRTILALPRS
ncbi:MAG: hypothetical protein AAF602_24370, partial [Myxococcota bacterium]